MKHHGITIHYDPESGYWAQNGSQSYGYCETIAEVKDEINRDFAQDRAAYADIDTPEDTPCLPDPWWATER